MILDDIIEVGKKFLPDKDKKLEYEIEMRKLNIDEFKEKKGIITRAFHLVFPVSVAVYLILTVREFWIKTNYFLDKDIWIVQDFVPRSLQILVLLFLGLLMPRKLLEPIVTLILKYFENKLKK